MKYHNQHEMEHTQDNPFMGFGKLGVRDTIALYLFTVWRWKVGVAKRMVLLQGIVAFIHFKTYYVLLWPTWSRTFGVPSTPMCH